MDSEDSEKKELGKVRTFPKFKRETPDEMPPVPLAHYCTDNSENFKWVIRLHHDGLHFYCSKCLDSLTLDEVNQAFEGDE